MADQKTESVKEEVEEKTIAEFLESTPPNQEMQISDLCYSDDTNSGRKIIMYRPTIQLYCNHDNCKGTRFFRISKNNIYDDIELLIHAYKFIYIKYFCANCQKTEKIFSLAVKANDDKKKSGLCYKFGERPPYGPQVSPKLIKLIGPDRDEFLQGMRCENQGLGVGAFTYYRRVVENQKNRIIGEIITVSEKIGAPADKIEKLKASLEETQFTKALGMAKDALPESLLINGHSPILLLHSTLSKGVHALTDEQCLELAGNVRFVLGNLSEKLSQALKDQANLTKALSTFMKNNKG